MEEKEQKVYLETLEDRNQNLVQESAEDSKETDAQ